MSKIMQRDIDAFVRSFDQSSWREMHLVGPGIDLFLSKDPHARRPALRGAAALLPAPGPDGVETAAVTAAHGLPAAAVAPAATTSATVPAHWIAIKAPCLGTFYSSPKPGAAAFVHAGQRVVPTSEVCLIEVMKLFTSVRAGVAGTVRQVLVADSMLVEFDQPLFYIEPDA